MSTSTLAPPRALSPSSSYSSPSSSRPRSRHSKKSDPFLELPVTPIPPPSPPRSLRLSSTPQPSERPESFFSQLILSPLLFTSFLLSLFLVDRNNRAYRVSERLSSPATVSALSRVFPSKWWDPEPYPTSDIAINGAAYQKKQPWYIKKKHRRVAKLEVTEAFELRTSVILGLIIGMLTVLIGGALGLKMIYDWSWSG